EDEETIKSVAKETGWNCEMIFDDGEDQYLVKLTLIG
ncbi:MAG: SAM-dependent methyltransferase, partial [Sphingobacteriales bacterium]